MIKNLLLKSPQLFISGVILGSVLTASTWAMDLPDENLMGIFSKLPLKDLTGTASVSKQWQRVSEDNTLWTPFCSPIFLSKKAKLANGEFKKACLKFPRLGLAHFKALFEQGYISRNELVYWKLVEKDQDPHSIMKSINQPNIQWKVSSLVTSTNNKNSLQYKTNLIFFCEVGTSELIHKEVPCTLTLKRTLSVEKRENTAQGPYLPPLSEKRLKKMMTTKQYKDVLARLWTVQEDQDFQTITECINCSNPHDIGKARIDVNDASLVYYSMSCFSEFITEEGDALPLPRASWPTYKLTLKKQ